MTKTTGRFERAAALKWVPLSAMRVSDRAQRDLKQARVDAIVANLDLEQVGVITVSERAGHFYIIDGQHRHAALCEVFDDDPDIKIQCWVYSDLTEEQEAERFLKLNDALAVSAFAKFQVAVTAGRALEVDIDRIVRANGCVISQDGIPGAIGGVGTLVRLYKRHGAKNLGRTVGVTNVAFGGTSLDAAVLGGIGAFLGRYNGSIDDARLVEKLRKVPNGARGIMWQANVIREQFGGTREEAFAAACVDIYNQGLAGRSGVRIPSWWKSQELAS